MIATVDKRENGWFLDQQRLPGIDVEKVNHYRREGYWLDKTLGDIIEEAARKWPERTALVCGDTRVSYLELNILSSRLALSFLDIGLQPRDIVAVQLPNILEDVLTMAALSKIGAVCNLIAPVMREKEVTYMLNHCKSKVIIVPHEYHKFNYYTMIRNIASHVPSLELVIGVGDTAPEGGLQFKTLLEGPLKKEYASDYLKKYRPDPDDISLIGFTSGTTALPKAYIHTYNTDLAGAFNCSISDAFSYLRKPCINMALAVFSYGYGRRGSFLSGVLTGATTVMVDPLSSENILDTFKRERPTHIHAAPAIYRLILDDLLSLKECDIKNLEIFHYAGSGMPFEIAKKLRSITHLITCYGSSEMAPICATNLFDSPEAQIYTSGRPAWGNKVAIVDKNGSRLGTDEEGEVVAKGPALIPSYLNNPEGNAQAFLGDGFVRTGDLGCFDESGYLHIIGRNKDIINRGGMKFSAREVEELILSHAKIKDAGIVSMPDERLQERSCAFVVLWEHETLKLEELVAYLRDKRLATFKLPERLEVVEALPYTSTGKMQKYILKERIAKIIKNRET